VKLIVIDGVKPLEEHFLKGKNVHIKFVTCGKERLQMQKRVQAWTLLLRPKKNQEYKEGSIRKTAKRET
jgi:hypothetical protein